MQQYREYKDSGIEWIGKIPVGWKVRRFRTLFSFSHGVHITKTDFTEQGILCVTYGDIHVKGNTELNPDIQSLHYIDIKFTETSKNAKLRKNDFVFADTSEDIEGSGNFAYLNANMDIMAGYHTIIAKPQHNESTRFLAYFFDSLWFRSQIRSQVYGVKVFSITKSILKNTKVLLPPLPEQEAIAAYLDEKTTHIDSAIANLQLQAEKLSAYKRQLIAKTVRRGLNETVTYKDSGIEWIGKIPAGWEVVPLKTVAKENRTRNIGMQCNVLLSLSYGNIITKDINSSFGLIPENFETYQIVNPGYIVLRLTDMQNDKRSLRSGYVTHRGIITSAYIGLIPMDNINNKYLSYVLHVYDLKKVYYALGSGLRQSIKYVDIKNLPILQPPLPEQEAIAAYLDKKITLIASITADIQRQIEQLKNYRKIIIHDAVTGRIKVPENAQ